jgi:hypothetical protein
MTNRQQATARDVATAQRTGEGSPEALNLAHHLAAAAESMDATVPAAGRASRIDRRIRGRK